MADLAFSESYHAHAGVADIAFGAAAEGLTLRFWQDLPTPAGSAPLVFGVSEDEEPPTESTDLEIAATLANVTGTVEAEAAPAPVDLTIAQTLANLAGTVDLYAGPPPSILEIAATLADLTGAVFLTKPVTVTISATLDDVAGPVEVDYDNSVWRWFGIVNKTATQQGEQLRHHAGSRYKESAPAPIQVTTRHQTAGPLRAIVRHAHGHLEPLPITRRTHHQQGQPVATRRRSTFHDLDRSPRPTIRSHHQTAQGVRTSRRSSWVQLTPKPHPYIGTRHQTGHPVRMDYQTPHHQGVHTRVDHRDRHQEGETIWGWGGPLPTPVEPEAPEAPWDECWGPHIGIVNLPFKAFLPSIQGILLFGCSAKESETPIRRSYLVIHDIHVLRLPDRVEIPAGRLSLSFDADSWAWKFSASLLGPDVIEMLAPVDGEPVQLEVAINGNVWIVFVEDWTETRSFAERGISVTGRSLTALLAVPYQQPRSYTEPATRTAAQLVEQEMPFGWSLDWDAEDWLVPAGAFSYQELSPIQAASRVAAAAGAILLPDPQAQALRSVQRYQTPPWEFDSATPDRIIPEQALLSVSRQLAPDPQANAVYVHGGETGGILARIYRTGTAGDRLANTVFDPLITDIDVARARGKTILSEQAQPPEVQQVTMALDDGTYFPLVAVGDLVEIALSTAVRGIVTGVNITVARAHGLKVRQHLTLGSKTPNLWTSFRDLMPSDPLLVGQIVSNHGNGTVTVEYTAGGRGRVRGTGSVGSRVYVRAGRVEDSAPSLPTYDVAV